MAGAAGVAVASIYYNQPMLGQIASEFSGSSLTGLIPTVTQLGYALGLIFLVPLGDLIERRRLIVMRFGLLAFALAATALAPTPSWLILASALLGVSATVAQQIVPFAAELAPARVRGAVLGTVMAGLLSGILLSRTIAGFITSQYGWREMFWLATPVVLTTSVVMACALPRSQPATAVRYASLLKSLIHLWRAFSELRWATITQALLFAAFSVFWSILALRLEQPDVGLGPAAAGLFGVIGLIGILAAPIAGRLADRYGPYRVVLISAVVTVLSWLVLCIWGSIIGLAVGVVLLDLGVQGAMVPNQHIIYALKPEARARLNTVFMSIMFLGGAAGSAAATISWQVGGWAGVAGLGITVSALAVGAQLLAQRGRGKQ